MFAYLKGINLMKVKFSKAPLKDWLLSLSPSLRAALVPKFTGSSLNYVQKRIWTPDYEVSPVFKLKIAVGLDKASQGQCDFRDMVDEGDEIDWEYVRHELNKRLKTEASQRKSVALSASTTI